MCLRGLCELRGFSARDIEFAQWKSRSPRSSSRAGPARCTRIARRWSTATFASPTSSSSTRCDRLSAALQRLGVQPGDRVAYIAPNIHAQLESFYAVPQIGAVLVPINYRLSAGRVHLHHQPLRRDRGLRARGLPRSARRRSGRSCRACGISSRSKDAAPRLARLRGAGRRVDAGGIRAPDDRRARSADDQLHQRHDVAAEGRDDHPPQRLHEHRRHAAAPADAAGRSVPVDAADVSRQRLDVHLER